MNEELKIIVDNVCYFYGVHPDAIQSKNQQNEIVHTRQKCHYLARKFTKLSHSKIAAEIGGKNHATCLHSVKVVNYEIQYYSSINEDIEILTEIIQPKLDKLRKKRPRFPFNIVREMVSDMKESLSLIIDNNTVWHFSVNYIRLRKHKHIIEIV